MNKILEVFGSKVFNDAVMRERLPKEIYKSLRKTISEGKDLDETMANVVAHAMKEWALENGATHYTHWFQPMTGITAEKHDSFIVSTDNGGAATSFTWRQLIKGEKMEIVFDDNRRVDYDFSLLDELEHAYAITVHKSQGSEYPIVIIPMYSFNTRLMTRNLIYTAVTRAVKMVIMVGKASIVQRMVDTNKPTKRYTGLEMMLSEN